MDIGGGPVMAMQPYWDLPYAILILVMWVVMMPAMMLPTAAVYARRVVTKLLPLPEYNLKLKKSGKSIVTIWG